MPRAGAEGAPFSGRAGSAAARRGQVRVGLQKAAGGGLAPGVGEDVAEFGEVVDGGETDPYPGRGRLVPATQNFSGSARTSSPRSSLGQRTAMEVSSSGMVAYIFPATRKVGMDQAIFSVVSGRERAMVRASWASAMAGG